MPYDRDVLTHIIIKKNGRCAAYESVRNTETDLPVLDGTLSGEGDSSEDHADRVEGGFGKEKTVMKRNVEFKWDFRRKTVFFQAIW